MINDKSSRQCIDTTLDRVNRNLFSRVQLQNIEHLVAAASHLTLALSGGRGSQNAPTYVFRCSKKTSSTRAQPPRMCKPYSVSHILRPGAAMCQNRSFLKACLSPLPFSIFPFVDIATVLSAISWKPHDHILGHSMSAQVQLGLVIFAQGHFRSCKVTRFLKLLTEMSYSDADGLIVFSSPRHID